MNTPNPLVPQGTIPSGKSTLRIAVFTILVIHVALIGGFLIQGCSKDKKPADELAYTETNSPEAMTNEAVPPLQESNAPAAMASNAPVTAPDIQPVTPPAPMAAPLVAPSSTTEYAVVKGDTLATIAKKHGISLKALEEANPGVDPKKLKLKQKLQIPASAAPAASLSTPGAEAATSSEGTIYTVKPGDVLAKIAKNHGTTVSAIVAFNNLKSKNSIKPGQKLKMPAPKTPAAPLSPAAAETPAAPLAPVTTSPTAAVR